MHRFISRWLTVSYARLWIAFFALYAASLQAAVVLTPAEQAFINTHPLITLGTDRSWEPFVIVDKEGNISGYDAEILDQINQLTGANFTLHAGAWNDVQQQAMNRELDGLSTGVAIEKRRAYLNFTAPYLILKKSVFVAKGNPANILTPADMQGKTVAIQQGNMADTELMKQFPGTKVLFVDSVEALFTALSDGSADAIFGNGATFYLANKLGMPYLQIGFHLDQQLELVFGVRNDWPQAHAILSKGLAALSEHQKIQIQTRWFSLPNPPEPANKSTSLRLSLTAEERGILEQLNNLRLCTDPRWLPFSAINKEGQLIGVSADLLALIQQRLNLNWQVIPTSTWSETLQLAKTGECDLISNIQATPEREVYLDFTQTLINTPLVLATRSDQFFIPDLRKVADHPIAIEKDTAAIRMIQNIYPEINLVEVDTVQEGLKLLSQEKVFGYIDSLEVIAHHVNQQRLLNIKISSTLTARYSLGLAVPKELTSLVPILNKAIRNISTEEFNQIYNRWIAIKYESSFDYRLLWTILSVIAVVIFFLIYRNRVVSGYNAKLTQLNEKLARQATTDQLTQLPNRYLLDREIQTALASAKRYKEPFSMVLFDLDFFKQINDQYGHQTGDKVLQEISQLMNQHCRKIDILGRWGGEEFLLLCPRTNLEGALKLANKIRAIVREHPFVDNNHVTLSAGVAQFLEDEGYSQLLKRLDDALYQAKHTGRDTVIIAESAQPTSA